MAVLTGILFFPIMKPMHATVAVLTAMSTWNDVMTPLVIMSGTGTKYVTTGAVKLPDSVRNKL